MQETARYQYIAFSRLIMAFETLMFFFAVLLSIMGFMPPKYETLLLVICGLRVFTELINLAWLNGVY